jgi:hypothetical protein
MKIGLPAAPIQTNIAQRYCPLAGFRGFSFDAAQNAAQAPRFPLLMRRFEAISSPPPPACRAAAS